MTGNFAHPGHARLETARRAIAGRDPTTRDAEALARKVSGRVARRSYGARAVSGQVGLVGARELVRATRRWDEREAS